MGRRKNNIAAALNALETTKEIDVIKVSKLYETDPVGGPPDQRPYMNAAAELKTSLTPERLLAVCQNIENALGRKRTIRWGPRTIDLDILLYDQEVIATPELTIPHPLMHERQFVMEPLVEIAPEVIHPMYERSAAELLRMLIAGEKDTSHE